MNDVFELFKNITTFNFDVDGVLTDGYVLVLENGLQARRMSVRDGFALQLAVKSGYRVMIVSGSSPSPVIDRLAKLGVTDVYMSVEDKRSFITSYIKKNKLNKEEVLYMGDDLPDLPAMSEVGLACCPDDATNEIKGAVQYISHLAGGCGCVRDVIEKVLKQNSQWHYRVDVTSS
jgi:3-deoxy-D-manno-octulosonate 8-phosphate phosphatase (KDO 8-P phosphatase)